MKPKNPRWKTRNLFKDMMGFSMKGRGETPRNGKSKLKLSHMYEKKGDYSRGDL